MSSMTNTFVEARYSKHALYEDHAERVRMMWGIIRNSLRKKPWAENYLVQAT